MNDLNFSSDQVIKSFVKKIANKDLHACGIGGREDGGKIMDFEVTFQYGQILDIASARKLITETTLLFLDEINADQGVRQYLHHYPFSYKDVIVSILHDCSNLNDEEIKSSVIVNNYLGRVSYCLNDGVTRPFATLLEESFEEAIAKLNEDRKF